MDIVNAEKSKVIQIIDINSLKDFQNFKEQIESLKKSGGKLNIHNIRQFIDGSIFVMLGTIIVLLIISTGVNIKLFFLRNKLISKLD